MRNEPNSRKPDIRQMAVFLVLVLSFAFMKTVTVAQAAKPAQSYLVDESEDIMKLVNLYVEGDAGASDNTLDNINKELSRYSAKISLINSITAASGMLYDTFTELGMVLMVIFLYIEIIKQAQRDGTTPEYWIRIFLVTAVCLTLMINLNYVFKGITQLGNGIMDMAAKAVDENSALVTFMARFREGIISIIRTGSSDNSTAQIQYDTSTFGMLAQNGTIALLMIFVNFAIDGIIYGLGIRMVIRRLFMPISLAQIPVEGLRGPAIRSLRRYLAYYVQEGLIYVVVMVGTLTMDLVMKTDALGEVGIIRYLAVKTAVLTVVASTSTIAGEIVGDS